MSLEKCQRCGAEEGGDLRTLTMSCLYDMDELNIPFKCKMGLGDKIVYSIRVCKDCRGGWMQSIEDWFNLIYGERDNMAVLKQCPKCELWFTDNDLKKHICKVDEPTTLSTNGPVKKTEEMVVQEANNKMILIGKVVEEGKLRGFERDEILELIDSGIIRL